MTTVPRHMPPDAGTILERSRGVLFSYGDSLGRLCLKALESSDAEDIHDLRVASRRLRAALDLYSPFAPKRAHAALRKKIRTLTRELGDLRNIDEMLLFFSTTLPETSPALESLERKLNRQRSKEFKRIHSALTAFDTRKFDSRIRKMVSGLNESALPERNRFSMLAYFSDVSIRHYLPIHELLSGSTAPERHEERHSLRITIKKWRYFLEIISEIMGCSYDSTLEHLKEYQSLLGKLNDISVFGDMLVRLKLPGRYVRLAREALDAEEARLLQDYALLADSRPLTYTFLL